MNRQPVDSSTIAGIGHDRATSVLEIEFSSGDVYEYFLVPHSVYESFLRATSKGRFFGDHVRDKYRFRRL